LKELGSIQPFDETFGDSIQEESLDAIIDMSDRFYRERFFPGKAFEILREIIASKKLDSYRDSVGSYERPKTVSKKGKRQSTSGPEIAPNDVYETFRRRTGLPRFIIFREERKRQEEIGKYLTDRIFGHWLPISSDPIKSSYDMTCPNMQPMIV